MVGDKDAAEPRLQIRLFGAFDARVDGAPLPPLRSRKVQWLLALLALRAGQAVDRTWLAGTLWPDSDPAQALYNLRQSLTNLRAALGAGNAAAAFLHQSGGVKTLSLGVGCAAVDALAFDAALIEGDLAGAVALYRGPLLEGCGEEWALPERRAREERYLGALETLADHALANDDDPRAAIAYLRPAVETDPFREHAQRALILALARAGNHAAAVQTYRDLRVLLRRELNVDPDPRTVAAFEQVRAEARRMAAPAPAAHPAPRAAATAARPSLPAPLTALIGRKADIARVGAALRTTRLLTLTGPGGVGKTRLAIAVAEAIAPAFPGGVFFIDLAPITDGELVARTVAGALDVAEQPGRPLTETLCDSLRPRSLLLILDNCEHLIDACAALADALLRACPDCRVLATSRHALGLTGGETRWIVPPLSAPSLPNLARPGVSPHKEWMAELGAYEAVQLFAIRARQASPAFQMSARNVREVAQVCARLDGNPLAIELAAARVRSLSVGEIRDRLDDRFRLLTGGSRAARPRQQTLRALIDWSYDLLSGAERALLARSAVFANGWTLAAAHAVCAADPDTIEDWEILDVLSSLVDKSLVQAEDGENGAGPVRYRMLETVRQYAAEKLAASPETARAVADRHHAFFLALAEEAGPRFTGPDQAQWMDRIEAEHDNIRAALDRNKGAENLRLAGSLWRFWWVRGFMVEGRERLAAATRHPDAQERTAFRARAVGGLGTLARQQGDYAAARTLTEECLAIRREIDDRPGIASSLGALGTLAWTRGDYPAARALYEESLALHRELGDKAGIASTLKGIGGVAYVLGDFEGARRVALESIALLRELGDRLGATRQEGFLGAIAGSRGDFVTARRHFENDLAVRRELGDRQGTAWVLDNLGTAACGLGEYARARELHEEALAIQRELGDRHGIGGSLHGLGALAFAQGDCAQAGTLYRDSLRIKHELGDRQGIAESFEALARVAAAVGQPARAATLWGADAALHEALGSAWEPKDRETFERAVRSLRETLGETDFDAARATGRALPLEDAVTLALEEPG